ncbi:tRNA-specific adenosine deaminase subunit tad2 [Daldinia childiae]|uniref:tRNA-specific adenosine deaminase subunit tad2 n=1 Tax=Daldinia childiae TaxID=326645 RepID=UPI0014481251|nr:tRNA-specific adenosine deaminase subunit tad2 [Daldinia childiae]KAF3061142.1 tRNA-specific adenosine deaminase subunit tad2 [Daldinia childiae]
MSYMSGINSSTSLMGFSVHQPAIGAPLQFFPAMGSKQLDEMIDAYVPGDASILDKRATVSMEFFEHSMATGELFKFFMVYPALGSATESPSIALADSGYVSNFTSPVMSESQWTQASNISSSSEHRAQKSSPKKTALSNDFSHLPGMKILTKDGKDVTNSASRGCKTKEQRDHAHLMRIIKACDSCRRKKVRCDPSHKRSSGSSAAKTAKKTKKIAAPSVPASAPPPQTTLESLGQSLYMPSFDIAHLSGSSFDSVMSESLVDPTMDWDQFVQYDEEPFETIPYDYDFFFDPAGHLTPTSSNSYSSPSQPITPAQTAGLENTAVGLTEDAQAVLPPYLNPGGEAGNNYADFNLYSPGSSVDLDDDPSLNLEQGLDSSYQYHTMAQSKKRGQKRGGHKGSGSKSVVSNAPNAPTTTQPNGSIIVNKPTSSQNHASPRVQVGVTPVANQGDTKVNSRQSDSQKPLGGKIGGQTRGLPPPTPFIDNRRENAPPHNLSSTVSQSQPPNPKPLLAEGRVQVQKTGTRSQHVTAAFVSPNKPAIEDNVPQNTQVEEVASGINCLTLDDISGSGEPPKPGHASTAAAPNALAAPIMVALPPTDKTAALKSPSPLVPNLPGLIEPQTEEERVERAYHLNLMQEALAMGNLALNTNETPVGCVLVHNGKVIAKGMNATNVTRNGTRHAEFMALSALLSRKGPKDAKEVDSSPALDDPSWEDVDPTDSHIYPYGQKLHPAPAISRSIISECVLYVTVEPCVMCASLLRQLGIKKVYFGAVNDKFGGTGGVFKIHQNSKPVPKPADRPYQNGYGPQDASRIHQGKATPIPRGEDDGDGGNVEHGYPVEGGYLRDEAVSLLRRFYVQENGRAPQPRKKEGRAARLFAMENQAKNGGSASEFSDGGGPVDNEAAADDGEAMEITNGTTNI